MMTPAGARPERSVGPGDLVQTLDNCAQRVAWVFPRAISSFAQHHTPGLRLATVLCGLMGPDT
ncbi:MAG: hypothetical protein AAF761_01865 [Pseudomonadota bacterium]